MLVRVGLVIGVLVLGSRIGWAQLVPTGPEFRVSGNRPARARETLPNVAAAAAGNIVVVWEAEGLPAFGIDTGVRARRFDAAGAPLGLDFEVNTTTEGQQSYPDVAMDAGGNFVVVWNAESQDGDNWGVFARRFDAAGAPQSGEFQVNSYTTGGQRAARVARAAAGSFVVAWHDQRGVFARRFDAAGVAQGAEFQVNTFTTDQASFPEIGADPAGNFVVVWADRPQDGDGFGVFGQRFDAAGIPQGTEFQVNTYTTNDQLRPSIAVTAGGAFVVAFTGYGDGSGYGAFVRRYDAAGVPQGPDFPANTFTGATQAVGGVATDASGGFVVTWLSYTDLSSTSIVARRYDAAGTALGGEFVVNTYTTNVQIDPGVAALPGGGFVVAWRTYAQFPSDPTGTEIVGQRLTPTCGDGAIQPGEGCDDAGNLDGDGCSHACVVESCYGCSGAPSTCGPIASCADGDGCCASGCEAATDDDCPAHVSGRRLVVRETADIPFPTLYRRNLVFVTEDPAVDTSLATGIDPATDGASLHLYNPATGDSACFELEPALSATWRELGRDPQAPILAYRDRDQVNGACRSARIVDGKRLKIMCRGTADTAPFLYSLDEPSQGSIAVRFRSGATEYCTVFGGTVTSDASELLFNARNAPAPAVCPVPPAVCP